MFNRFEISIDQATTNVTKELMFQTGLGGNSLSAITIVGVELEFLKPIDPAELSVFTLATTSVAEELTDNDVLVRVPVWNTNPGIVTATRFDQRQTVQRDLYAKLESYTAILQKVRAVVYYEMVTLKEVEYLRLAAAGA